MQKIKNIIFDLGGVILNIDKNAVLNNIAKLGFDAKQIIEKQSVVKLLLDFETGCVDTDAFHVAMKNLAGMDGIDDEVFDRVWCSILLDFPEDRIETIMCLKREYRIFLLSNTNKLHYDKFTADFLNQYGYSFDSLFDHTYYSFEMGLAKPDSDIFRTVLRETNIVPDETVYVDDSPANTAAAAELGIRSLTIKPNSGFEELMLILKNLH